MAFIVIAIFAIIIYLNSLIQFLAMTLEFKRQLFHLFGMIMVIASYFIPKVFLLLFLILGFVVGSTLCFFRPLSHRLGFLKRVLDYCHSFARAEERRLGIYIGITTIFFSGFISLLVFGPAVFRIAMLVLAVGDSFSTLIGVHFGKHKISFNRQKTWEGSIAGLLTSFIACLIITSLPLAIIAAVVGMIVESLPIRLDDNFTIPLAVSIVMWFII